jgi:hypothetical protein
LTAIFLLTTFLQPLFAGTADRPRLCVLTDIGGDPDDMQSLVRLMVYLNEFEMEGFIASASGVPGQLKEPITRQDLILQVVRAYGEVRSNLAHHAAGWPTEEQLVGQIKVGNSNRGRDHIGSRHDTEASRWLVERIDSGTAARPLNIAIWGGQTDLAQALWRVKNNRSSADFRLFLQRFRAFEIGDQDHLADWMHEEFPEMNLIVAQAPPGIDSRESSFRGMYLGGDESLTSPDWIERNIRSKSRLGALYPTKAWTSPNPYGCMKEGDTPSWFFFLPVGGNDPADPSKPGWGGRYVRSPDGWWRDPESNPREAIYSRRPAFQGDFAQRMSWTAKATP